MITKHPHATIYQDEHGSLHRTDGPAIEWETGEYTWYVRGIRMTSLLDVIQLTNMSDDELTIMILRYGQIEEYLTLEQSICILGGKWNMRGCGGKISL
jgi:hypothetical protein